MFLLHVAAGVLNQTPLDWDGNQARIVSAIRAARNTTAAIHDRSPGASDPRPATPNPHSTHDIPRSALRTPHSPNPPFVIFKDAILPIPVSILCLPELCITGYGCEDAFQSPGTHRQAWRVLQEILPETQGMIVSVGLPIMHNNALFNAAALLVDGKLAGLTAKRFLAGDGIHYEPRWFKPWPAGYRAIHRHGEEEYPLGDLYFDCGGVRIGFEICEDAWVANRPGSELSLRGVDVILNPSASHFAFGKTQVRRRFVLEGSRAFGVSYIYSNLLGNEAGRAIYDGDAMIASDGQLVACGPRFSYDDFHLVTAVVDVDLTRMNRARTASFKPVLTHDPAECVSVPFRFPPLPAQALATPPHVFAPGDWEAGPHVKEEEFARAVPLALFDYLRKSRSRGFVVSLSGGVDSAAVSCLAAMMVQQGVAQLGLEGFKEKLRYIPHLREAGDVRSLVRALLTCVYQATRNSGQVTRHAARGVAEAIGAEYLEFDVDALVQDYVRIVSQALGRELTWQQDDIALQNIQARVRSPSVWLLANVRSALLLSTSNRSEAAVGYATMDGDTSGGLCPIAGIDKAFLRRWLVWLETQGPRDGKPIAALRAVNQQAPTAELRPPASKQTDEDDLMPYEVLDAIERAAIRDKRAPLEIFMLLQPQFSYSARQLALWVERFFTLWCRNQWKRERYAPSFHLDDENLDPKTWCRFPILSGGFARELRELREYVQSLAQGTGG